MDIKWYNTSLFAGGQIKTLEKYIKLANQIKTSQNDSCHFVYINHQMACEQSEATI